MNRPDALRILLTGPTGFIGPHVCARLAHANEIFGVTRGKPVPPGCHAIRADLGQAFSTAAWPEPIDVVVHLAQSPRYREFPDGASDMAAINVSATAALIEYARRAGASLFILASTGNVYTPGPRAAAEDDSIAPASFYAASKAAAECLVRPYREMMRVCILRLFYPYGPGQEGRLIPSLVDRIRDGRPVQLAGEQDGLMLTPTYVDDIADVMVAAMADRRFEGVFNVGSPEVVSLRAVGEAIGRVLGREPRFENGGGAEPPRLIPNVDRLAERYPLAQFTPLDAGLSRMLGARPLTT
jgi:UDP-glucose 4-epimerase